MPADPVETLLRELEPLRHSARIARMVEVGRLAHRDARTRETITRLAAGDVYARMLALQSCFGSRDGALALRLLADPSRLIRGRARVTIADVCDDTQALQALEALAERGRRAMLRLLRLNCRQSVIDAWLERQLSATGVLDAAVLAYASPAVVARLLPLAIEAGLSSSDIARLASFHPQLIAEHLLARAAAAQEYDQRLFLDIWSAIRSLAVKTPAQAIELLQLLLRHVAPAQLSQPLQILMRHRPNEVAELLLSHEGPSQLQLLPVADRLTPQLRRRLLAERPETLPLAESWFRRIPAAERLSLYREFERGWRDTDGCLPAWLIARLPGEVRQREARAHWRHPRLAVRPAQRFTYACCLPWDEARQELESFIRNPDAELRAPAGAALLACVRFDRSRTGVALEFVVGRKNEQDPVRLALLTALAGLPPRRWTESLPALGQVIRQALDAADLSYTTAAAAERLIVAALPFHSEWAIPWLATLVKERGHVNLGALHLRLNDAEVARIAPALLPVLQAWDHRERHQHLIVAAFSLGKRLRAFPEFAEILEGMALSAQAGPASGALNVLAQFLPERFRELVPRLLVKDASIATLPVIYGHLHARRQDLLTPFLGRTAFGGRFGTGRTRFVLPLFAGFFRWTPAQVQTFAATLEEVAHDEKRDSPALLFVIGQMAALPGLVSPALLKFSRLENPRLATRDAALRGLGRLDAGEGASLLLETLADDRGRIGIYALRASILEMSGERALAVLRAAPLEKVTVAKEVARLLGELRSNEAWELLREWDGRELHRDVRIALLRALWSYLDREEAWDILDRAAASPVAAVATMAGRTTAERLSDQAAGRLVRVLAALLSHSDAKVRCDVLQRCATMPVQDARQELLQPLMERLGSPTLDEARAAAGAVFATYAGRQSDAVHQAMTRLLPSREALVEAVAVLLSHMRWNLKLRPAARAVVEVLATDPLTIVLEVKLAVATLKGAELARYLIGRAAAFQADAVCAASEAISSESQAAALQELESLLGAQSDPQLRRLALAALHARGLNPPGWTDEVRERLEAYRRDPAVLVAAAATFLFPPEQPVLDEDKEEA